MTVAVTVARVLPPLLAAVVGQAVILEPAALEALRVMLRAIPVREAEQAAAVPWRLPLTELVRVGVEYIYAGKQEMVFRDATMAGELMPVLRSSLVVVGKIIILPAVETAKQLALLPVVLTLLAAIHTTIAVPVIPGGALEVIPEEEAAALLGRTPQRGQGRMGVFALYTPAMHVRSLQHAFTNRDMLPKALTAS